MGIQPHEWDDFLEEIGSDRFFAPVVEDSHLGYADPLATSEQRKRDKQITKLLGAYLRAYQKKVKNNALYRYIILAACLLIVAGFAVLLGYISSHIVSLTSTMETQALEILTSATETQNPEILTSATETQDPESLTSAMETQNPESPTGAMETQNLIAFITVCISFVSLVFGLLTIITKYVFPENDEQYITTIVQAIQHNDLENKKLAAKWEEKTSGIDDDQ